MLRVVFRERTLKSFGLLSKQLQQKILHSLQYLADHPFSHPQVKKIQGATHNLYRMRIGRWRVIYFLMTKEGVIDVLDLFLKKSEADYDRRLRKIL